MTRVYHRCHFCGGAVIEQRVTVDYRWGDAFLVVIRHVPAGVCQVCGEQYLKAEVVKEMEKVAPTLRRRQKKSFESLSGS